MKKIFFIRVGLFILMFPIFVIIQAPSKAAVYDMETAVVTSCKDRQSTFPGSLFARLNRDIKGSVSGFEIHLSYENDACSSLLYATGTAESRIGVSLNEDNDLIFALR